MAWQWDTLISNGAKKKCKMTNENMKNGSKWIDCNTPRFIVVRYDDVCVSSIFYFLGQSSYELTRSNRRPRLIHRSRTNTFKLQFERSKTKTKWARIWRSSSDRICNRIGNWFVQRFMFHIECSNWNHIAEQITHCARGAWNCDAYFFFEFLREELNGNDCWNSWHFFVYTILILSEWRVENIFVFFNKIISLCWRNRVCECVISLRSLPAFALCVWPRRLNISFLFSFCLCFIFLPLFVSLLRMAQRVKHRHYKIKNEIKKRQE